MNDGYVAMEKHQCVVCAELYDTGNLLLDRRMMNIPKNKQITGNGLCPKDSALHDQGFVALIGVDPARSHASDGRMTHDNASRTGMVMHMQSEAFEAIFYPMDSPVAYVEQPVLDMLAERYKKDVGTAAPTHEEFAQQQENAACSPATNSTSETSASPS